MKPGIDKVRRGAAAIPQGKLPRRALAAVLYRCGHKVAALVNAVRACRPESRIAVVAHAGIMRHTLSAFASGLPAGVQPDLTHEFANCEMRSMVLSDAAVTPPPDKTRFPGGREWEKANL